MWTAVPCRVCLHPTEDIKHWVDECIGFGCREKIRVCMAEHEVQDIDGTIHPASHGPMVCRECPYHGRKGEKGDYSTLPVVKRRCGRITVVKCGEPEEAQG